MRRYLPYKQGILPFEQQKWVGPYTITRVHDDNTIQIKNLYQKDLGRWKSNGFSLYDSVNPNQVITFDQEGMEELTPPNYDEMHHKMLECYSIQPRGKGALDEKYNNNVKVTKIENILLEKRNEFEGSMRHTIISKNSYASGLWDYYTTIKGNTFTKTKVTKGILKHNMVNKLSSKRLQYMFETWGLIYMTLITQGQISSIHPFKTIQRSGDVNMDFKEIDYATQVTKRECQQKFRYMKLIMQSKTQGSQKPINTKVLVAIPRVKSDFYFYWRGPHKADPKKVKEPTTQGSVLPVESSKTCKNHTYLHKEGPTSQIDFTIKNKNQFNSSLVSKPNKISVQTMSGQLKAQVIRTTKENHENCTRGKEW